MRRHTLLGRDREITVLHDLLDHIDERGGALVVRGEAGIGKSALLADARTHAKARGLRTLIVTGVQSESVLSFAGLHQLMQPVLDHASQPLKPQQKTLLAAFGMAEIANPSRLLIALAALELLSDAAAQAPLLLLIEDAQWLDPSTAEVLAFVARRLESEPIALLVAVRDGAESIFTEAGLPELHLKGLDGVSSITLLSKSGWDLDSTLTQRVLQEAQGNPLALLELPVAIRDRGSDEGALPLSMLPLTARLESAFLVRAATLSDATRTFLLVAASDDGDDLGEILAASSIVLSSSEVAGDALSSALQSTLVSSDGRHLHFRHPLVRSAIYQGASAWKRHAAHMALATVLSDAPNRRVWHSAASVFGTNDRVSAELEGAAERAEQRGDVDGAVVALERAGQLATQPSRRGELLLKAGLQAAMLGRHGDAVRLFRAIEPLQLGARERVQLNWYRELYDDTGRAWSGATRLRDFVQIANEAHQDGDDDLALRFLNDVSVRCYWSNPDEQTRQLIVASAERLAVREDTPALIETLALAAPIERGALVLERLAHLPPPDSSDPLAMFKVADAAGGVGAMDTAARFVLAAVAGLRARGWLGELARALVNQAYAAIHTGNWQLAMVAADEAKRLAREAGLKTYELTAQASQAMLAGLRGDEDLAESLATAVERVLISLGANPLLALVQLARGYAALGAGRYSDAFDNIARIFAPKDIAYHATMRFWGVADLAEAALHGGRQDEARPIVEAMVPLADLSHSPILSVGLLYARQVLGAEETSEARFREALAADLTTWPFHRARLLLAFGSWLRRRRRVAASRAPLRAAREAFDALGAEPWSERARQELRASGESSRQRMLEAWDQLSPQELQIAQMAAKGLSNREIGQRLFLSHRTVGYHLYRIFPKLGIASRAELRFVPGIELALPA